MDGNTLRFFKERNEAIKKAKDELWEKGPFFRSEAAQYTIQLAFEKGSEWEHNRIVEKAVRWLEDNASLYINHVSTPIGSYSTYDTHTLLDDFKQAMEE